MSTESSAANPVLEVWAADRAAEIFVINNRFELAARAVGSLRQELPPGIYKVKVRVGYETQEDYVALRAGDPPQQKKFASLSFPSPAPVANTAKTHEYHIKAAEQESRRTHAKLGQGSFLFLFARDFSGPGPSASPAFPVHPAAGLTLRSLEGEVLADFAGGQIKVASDLSQDPWLACNMEVDPGPYLLRLTLPTRGQDEQQDIQQTIVTAPGWQTQIFLLQKNYGPKPEERRADLAAASVLLGRSGFSAFVPDARLVELARLGLMNHKQVLSADLRQMLVGKFDDPMLGIYGGHLLLLDRDPNLGLLGTVVRNLRGLLGTHPDVEALALRTSLRNPAYEFKCPPMLRRSWELVVGATADQPELVPRGSVAAAAANRVVGSDLWLQWMAQAESLPTWPKLKGVIQGVTREGMILASIPMAHEVGMKQPPPAEPVAVFPKVAALRKESGAAIQTRKATGVPQAAPDIKTLVTAMGLPRFAVEDFMQSEDKGGKTREQGKE